MPANLMAAVAGGQVGFSWLGPLGATGYRMLVGTTPGASNVADADIGAATSLVLSLAGVPSGTYYVRVAAMSACGVGAPSNEVAVTVP